MINISNMSFGYLKDVIVLRDINISVKKGERVGIIGANGVGKSTLLRLLCGLETEYLGEINVGDVLVTKKSLRELRKHIGYVFQDSDAQMFLTNVRDNVAFGPSNYGLKGKELESAVDNALDRVGINGLKNKPVYMLSGGEKKLASIATVLAIEPEVLIFDEPSAALDPGNRRLIINVLNKLDKTIIVASHDLDFVLDTCDRVILLNDHTIEKDDSSRSILCDANLLERCGLELPLKLQKE